MSKRITGFYRETTLAGETIKAFVPKELPPVDPVLDLSQEINTLLSEAKTRLSEIKIASHLVPNPDFFNYLFVRKEAVLSSQIEGVQATLTDLLNYEADSDKPRVELEEVCNYLDALNFARKQIHSPMGLPISLRLISEMHKRLMKGVRGSTKQPGQIRVSQNWIGGPRPSRAHFVPPPPLEMKKALEALEVYIHKGHDLDPLIRIGLIHVQFETIHPFLDGNGRLGRLLIALLLEAWGILDSRLLYLSLHFKRNQQEYYSRLDAVRTKGDWEGWIRFFLDGICLSGQEAVNVSQELFKLFELDRRKLLTSAKIAVPAIRLFEELPRNPVITLRQVVELLNTTKPTASKAIDALVKVGILQEITGGKRNRLFRYSKYIGLLE
ncbi:MAG: Fic family protein [Bdellovibrionales bacterium]|nr:Fic family protein [Bdellovibrionales bacterium]